MSLEWQVMSLTCRDPVVGGAQSFQVRVNNTKQCLECQHKAASSLLV